MDLIFASLSTVFQLFQDDGRMIFKKAFFSGTSFLETKNNLPIGIESDSASTVNQGLFYCATEAPASGV